VLPVPVPVVDGAPYWIAVHSDAAFNSRDSDGADQDLARRILTLSFASGLPDPFGTANNYVTTRGMRMLIWTNP
jgi:hypothetical protein